MRRWKSHCLILHEEFNIFLEEHHPDIMAERASKQD